MEIHNRSSSFLPHKLRTVVLVNLKTLLYLLTLLYQPITDRLED